MSAVADRAREAPEQFSVLGFDFFGCDAESASRAIVERALAGGGGYACFCSVHALMEARRDERVRLALAEAWAVFPDGVPIVWLARGSGAVGVGRACGIDVMPRAFELGQERGLRHYLFGSSPGVLELLERQLRAACPRARIVGSFSPPFVSVDEISRLDAVKAISTAEPHVVWCGLGAPKQEMWMRHFARALAPALLVGVGAAFEFVGGARRRAPTWMQRNGLEWLHRLGCEPRRLAGRYLRTNSEFVVCAALELARRRDKP